MKNNYAKNIDTLLRLYKLYDEHRDSVLWFLEDLDANNYQEYLQKYPGSSNERSRFISICGFFELSGVIVKYRLIDQNLYRSEVETSFQILFGYV
jgi:hypothetical protein